MVKLSRRTLCWLAAAAFAAGLGVAPAQAQTADAAYVMGYF
jgi:hypothetical protein